MLVFYALLTCVGNATIILSCDALVMIALSLRQINRASKTLGDKIADRQNNEQLISVSEGKKRGDTALQHYKSFIVETEDQKADLGRRKSS